MCQPPTLDTRLRKPLARCWNQRGSKKVALKNGAVPITPNEYIDLEDGIQVRFGNLGRLRPGDYWQIVARVGAGIDWPQEANEVGVPLKDQDNGSIPKPLPPFGVAHHFAPIAVLLTDAGGVVFDKEPALPQIRNIHRSWVV